MIESLRQTFTAEDIRPGPSFLVTIKAYMKTKEIGPSIRIYRQYFSSRLSKYPRNLYRGVTWWTLDSQFTVNILAEWITPYTEKINGSI